MKTHTNHKKNRLTTTVSAGILAATLIAFGSLAGGVYATTIYNNGAPITSVIGWDATGSIEADNFTVASNSSIQQAKIYINDEYGLWDSTLEYFIYSDAGSAPGSILASGEGQNPTISLTGIMPLIGQEIQAVTFELESPFLAQAGTTYWFGMHLKSDYVRYNTRWAVSSETGNHFYQSGGAGGWFSGGDELAFELTYVSIPEPSSMLLVGCGTFAFIGRRRRKS
jgi:hypothetical protein